MILLDTLRARPDRVLLYGHRGARSAFAENTMPGFEYLRMIGIDAVEIDVQNAAGSVPVLVHNPLLPGFATRDARGQWIASDGPKVIATPHAELATYDVGALRIGSEYQMRFSSQARLDAVRIPTFADFCAWAADQPGFVVNVEIKSIAYTDTLGDAPAPLTHAILDVIEAHGLVDRVVISSFDWRCLTICAERAPGIPLGCLTEIRQSEDRLDQNIYVGSPWLAGIEPGEHQSLPDAVADFGMPIWCPYYLDLTAADLARAKARGLVVNVWTVNAPADIRRMVEMGVDGIITDDPALAQNVLAGMGHGWRHVSAPG